MSRRLLHSTSSHPESQQSRVNRTIPPNLQSLRLHPEIVELARAVFVQAQAVLSIAQPLAHTRYTSHGIGPFSAKQFVFKDDKKRYEIQQSGLTILDDRRFWDRTRVTANLDTGRWSLSATHNSDPASLMLTRNRQLDISVADAHITLHEMSRSLESWLQSRNNGDDFAKHVLPVLDRLDGFFQGFSHRVSPPKD